MIDVKKNVEETVVDNRTSFFGDPSRFGIIANSGLSGGGPGGNNPDGKCCSCSPANDKGALEAKEKEQQFRIDFENVLQNRVYVRGS